MALLMRRSLTLATQDEQYTEAITTKYFPMQDLLENYNKSLNEFETKESERRLAQKSKENEENEKGVKLKAVLESIPDLQLNFSEALDTYLNSKREALSVTKCLEGVEPDNLFDNSTIQIQPADDVKQALAKSFEALLVSVAQLKNALKLRGHSDKEIEEKIKFNRSQEQVEIGKLNIELSKILEAKRINSDRRKLSVSGPALSSTLNDSSRPYLTPIKLNKPDPIKFSGEPRDFAAFRRDFEAIIVPNRSPADIGLYLKQAIPAKDVHILNNVDLDNYTEMMSILSAKFGSTRRIVDSIITDIDKLKVVTTDKMFIEYVERLERINRDVVTVKIVDEIANATVISKLESKLPIIIYKDWSDLVIEKCYDEKSSREKFDNFMSFLSKKKKVVEYQLSDARNNAGFKAQTQSSYVTGLTTAVKVANKEKGSFWKPCLACNADGATDLASTQHSMENCEVWGSLSQREKESLVKCLRHPFASDHTTQNCTIKTKKCRSCDKDGHHFLLCSKLQVKSSSNVVVTTNTASVGKSSLPVMVQAQFVNGVGNSKIGTLMDLCSTDDYVTHRYALKKKFPSEEVNLIIEGVGGKESRYNTKVYQVPIFDMNGNQYIIPCFGLETISSVTHPSEKGSYRDLCDRFGIKSFQVKRPESIDLLLSMRHNFLHPKPVKSIGGMILYDGILGKVFGGSDPHLVFTPHRSSYPSSVHLLHQSASSMVYRSHAMRTVVKEAAYTLSTRSDREFLNYFQEESIGVECNPKCGGCRCGKCATGAKQMSIRDERLYDSFKELMHLDLEGSSIDPGPYWVSRLPWILDKNKLTNNKPAVLGVMNSTMRKLSRDPNWKAVYESQLRDLLDKGFAREVSSDELNDWIKGGGKHYFIAHQVALNPDSKSTPVRVVFNSSQIYKGFSLNSSLELGPDIMNNLHGVLLRFRTNYVGGQGDIKKMFYMVRIPKEDQMMQLFLWQFPGDQELRMFCMNRLVMGNKPSGNLSLVALKETADLASNKMDFPAAYQAIKYDSYVDNIFVTASNSKELQQKISEIEKVSSMGGFHYKEWIVSGQNIPEQLIGVPLENSLASEEEKALGIYWDVKEDEFYVKSNLGKPSKRVKRKDVVVDVSEVNGKRFLEIKQHLTLRICLSLHALSYDPLGFVLPTRMIGQLLFRDSLQDLKKDRQGKIPWDEPLGEHFHDKWVMYFQMLLMLEDIRFPRCIIPHNSVGKVKPDLVTFNDGNPNAYGVVAYAVFTLEDGHRAARFLMAKAKLGPLTHKGETVKNELSGSTIAARIKVWLIQESGLEFANHYHFLDSRIVQDMMKKQSYGFNTFAGLRVGEIQQKTSLDDWLHIPNGFNIADILTKGETPNKLGVGSSWQDGPTWIVKPRAEWPVTTTCPDTDDVEVEISKFYKKCTSAAVGSKVIQEKSGVIVSTEGLDGLIERCSSLEKLLRCVAYVMRAAARTRRISPLGNSLCVNATERSDAYNILIYWEQQRRLQQVDVRKFVPYTVTAKLENYKWAVSHVVIGGRVRKFPIGFARDQNIPIIPYSRLGKLLVLYYHNKYHRDVDTTVAYVRRDIWVVKARKFASVIDSRCRICLENRKHVASQEMGKLPSFRSDMLPSFTVTCMDLFGPYEIRDDCIKRGPRVVKKVYGVIFTCPSTRAIHLDVAVNYSTQAVLHTVRRLMAIRGDVRKIISDPGTQLVGASKEILDWRKGWDEEQLIRFGAERGLEWETISANSQHQNGVTEILINLVKVVRKSIISSLGDTRLTLNEMNTLMLEITNLVNERPIGTLPNSQTDSEYLSPNSLLLGRCSARISSGPFQQDQVFTDDSRSIKDRFLLVQSITAQFWKIWMRDYFPSLLVRQKWHSARRNLEVGDVCILKDSNAFRGEWRICRVSDVFPDASGKVRNVAVIVKPRQGGSKDYVAMKPISLNRHVNNLVVLVPIEDQEVQEQSLNVEANLD